MRKIGYTIKQIKRFTNVSHDMKYWNKVGEDENGKPLYLFRSKVAESWEYFDPQLLSPIRNTEQHYIRFLDSKVFSDVAFTFRRQGAYTTYLSGTLDYERFWDDVEDNIHNGVEIEGVLLTGRHYFYLNFGRLKARPVDENGKEIPNARKIETFPRFLDHNFYFFHEVDRCLLEGIYSTPDRYYNFFKGVNDLTPYEDLNREGIVAAKSRRKGFTYQVSAGIYAYNFIFKADSTNLLAAFEKDHYKVTLDGINKTRNFVNKHTPWVRRTEFIGQRHHFKASFKNPAEDGTIIEEGYKSEVHAISFKNNPFKSIGESADILGFEEAGKFENLLTAYAISEPLFRDGDFMIGIPIIWGCVCAGTKVWTKDGREVNIEDLHKEDGIIGYAGVGAMQQPIIGQNPVAKKECYRITTSNNKTMECSYDHPLLWSKNQSYKHTKEGKRKKVTFKRAEDIKVGDQLMCNRQIPVFGDKRLWEPRFVGLMLGDGNYSVNATPSLSIFDVEVLEYIKERELDYSLGRTYKQVSNGKDFYELKIRAIRKELRELGIFGQTKDKKQFPDNIHRFDLHSITELLGGYFEADGNVYYNKKKNAVRIVLTSANKHLLEEAQRLLYKLSVSSTIREEERKEGFKPGMVYRLYISKKEDVRQFKKHIKFLSKHKQEILDIHVDDKPPKSIHDNCYFELNPDNNKGTYFTNHNKLDNLESCYVKEIEFIGEQEIYNLNTGITHTYITNGFISGNTGGDMEGGSQDLAEMFDNPNAYGLRGYDNIYEPDRGSDTVGWFIDDMWYLPGNIKKDIVLKYSTDKEYIKELLSNVEGDYVEQVDAEGNSYRRYAEASLDAKREIRAKGSKAAYNKFITQQPKVPSEAFLRTETSPFDTVLIDEQLAKIRRLETSYYEAVDFVRDDTGRVKLTHSLKKPILTFPLKEEDTEGCWTIFNRPIKDNDGNITPRRYIAGTDPVDFDKDELSSKKFSLASTFIIDTFTRNIVAEYTARTYKVKTYYDNLIKGLEYYNAKLMYESNLKGLFFSFKNSKKDWMLADEPALLRDVSGYVAKPGKKGFHATASLNAYARELLHEWSVEEVPVENPLEGEEGYTMPRMYKVLSLPLLLEMKGWRSDGNFDRVSSMGAAMIYLFSLHVKRDTKEEDRRNEDMKYLKQKTKHLRKKFNLAIR